MLHHCINY